MRPSEQRALDEAETSGIQVIRTSHLKTSIDCKRKAAFELIDGLISPTTPAAALGSATHDLLEKHFEGKHPVFEGKPGKLAEALLGLYTFIPQQTPLRVERLFLREHETWIYRGTPDLEFFIGDDHYIVDHKTSRDPLRWGLNKYSILFDLQAVCYSWNGMLREGTDEVNLCWGYVNTQGKIRPYKVEGKITRAQALERVEENHEHARTLLKVLEAPRANDVEPNYDACGKFGGCPFFQYCKRTVCSTASLFADLKDEKEEDDMGFVSKLAKKRNIKNRVGRDPDIDRSKYEEQEQEEEALEDEETEEAQQEDQEKPKVRLPPKRKFGKKQKGEAKTERTPNAPEVDRGDDEELVEASKASVTGGARPVIDKQEQTRRAEEIKAKSEEKAEPMDASEVLEALYKHDGTTLRLSVKRAQESKAYVQKKTLEALAAAGKIEYFLDGQIAHISEPTNNKTHGSVWLQALIAFEDLEQADEVLTEYKKRFG